MDENELINIIGQKNVSIRQNKVEGKDKPNELDCPKEETWPLKCNTPARLKTDREHIEVAESSVSASTELVQRDAILELVQRLEETHVQRILLGTGRQVGLHDLFSSPNYTHEYGHSNNYCQMGMFSIGKCGSNYGSLVRNEGNRMKLECAIIMSKGIFEGFLVSEVQDHKTQKF